MLSCFQRFTKTMLVTSFFLFLYLFCNVTYATADVLSLDIQNTHAIFQNAGGFTGQLGSQVGFSLAMDKIGDLDGDGNEDLVVGSERDNSAGLGKGAIWILFLNSDTTVKSYQKIYSNYAGFTGNPTTMFGAGVANLGDIDDDGVNDIAVASLGAGSSGGNSIWILFMNQNGTVKTHQKISNNSGGFNGVINENDNFGWRSLEGVGDIDGDGVPDLAVGAEGRNTYIGSVLIFFLNSDGTVKFNSEFSLADGVGNAMRDHFGSSIANLGDTDNDGVNDIVVGAFNDGDGASASGAVWVVKLNSLGGVKSAQKISALQGGLENQLPLLGFGSSVENIGDINNDGVTDIAVGEPYSGQRLGLANPGAIWLLELNQNGTVQNERKFENWVDFPKIYSEQRNLGSSIVYFKRNGSDVSRLLSGGYVGLGGLQGGIMAFEVSNLITNQAPIFEVLGNKTTAENQALIFTSIAQDPDNNSLDYLAVGLPEGSQYNAMTGEFNWTPTYNQSGTYPVTFTVSDGELTDSETIDIVVTNVNRAPVLAPIGNQIISENQTLSFSLSASDADGNNLSYSALNLPSGATFSGNTFSWTPTYAQAGNYENIEFAVTDNGSPMELAVELVTITVGDVNRAPELTNPGPQSNIEGQNVSFTITATDPDGDTVTLSAVNLPSGATFSSNTGVFSWNPSNTQAGIYTPTFTATDNGSPIESSSLDVVITIGDDPTPVEQAQLIINTVVSFNLPNNITNSYMANLQKIEPFINNGQIQPALNQLNAFINKVNQDYSQNKITLAQRNQLVAIAQGLINDLQ